jgi:hypothetical protein
MLLNLFAAFALWHLGRFIVKRVFRLGLLAISEIGAAWRGELDQ